MTRILGRGQMTSWRVARPPCPALSFDVIEAAWLFAPEGVAAGPQPMRARPGAAAEKRAPTTARAERGEAITEFETDGRIAPVRAESALGRWSRAGIADGCFAPVAARRPCGEAASARGIQTLGKDLATRRGRRCRTGRATWPWVSPSTESSRRLLPDPSRGEGPHAAAGTPPGCYGGSVGIAVSSAGSASPVSVSRNATRSSTSASVRPSGRIRESFLPTKPLLSPPRL